MAGFVLLVVAISPFSKVLIGAVRYGLEQSSINTQANGIASILSPPTAANAGGVFFWEIVRSSWLLVTVGIGGAAYLVLRSRAPLTEKLQRIALALPIVILGGLYVYRAGGRINTRLFFTAGPGKPLVCIRILPMYVFQQIKYRYRAEFYLLLTLAGATLTAQPWKLNNIDQFRHFHQQRSPMVRALEYPLFARFSLIPCA